jgi:hypothetical protein
MNNTININHKFSAVPLAILLAITIVSSGGFVGWVYAHENLKVDCKDLALALFTWDRAFGMLDSDDVAEIEHILEDEDIEPNTIRVENLLDGAEDQCDDEDVEKILEQVDLFFR